MIKNGTTKTYLDIFDFLISSLIQKRQDMLSRIGEGE